MIDLVKETQVLAGQVIKQCIDQHMHIIAAESMTGGLFINELTNIQDASKVIDRSYIVYSDQAKIDILNVSKAVIEQKTVYSEEVVLEMIEGLKQLSPAEIKIAISGIAGPSSYAGFKVGTVFIAIAFNGSTKSYHKQFDGDRLSICYQTVIFIYQMLLSLLK